MLNFDPSFAINLLTASLLLPNYIGVLKGAEGVTFLASLYLDGKEFMLKIHIYMVTFMGQNCNSNSKLSILVHSEIITLNHMCVEGLYLYHT